MAYKIEVFSKSGQIIETSRHSADSLSQTITYATGNLITPEAQSMQITDPLGRVTELVNSNYKEEDAITHRRLRESQEGRKQEEAYREAEARKKAQAAKQAELERQNRFIEETDCTAINDKLQEERNTGNDYVGIKTELRDKAESLYISITSRPLSQWESHHIELYRTLIDFPRRREYLQIDQEERMKKVETILENLNGNSNAQLSALLELGPQFKAIGSQINQVKNGTTVSGLWAYKNLSENISSGWLEGE
jgi:small-conductance mechanosensitive channel